MNNLLEEKLKIMVSEPHTYITKNGVEVSFQRLITYNAWYAIVNNQIVNWGQYRYDLEEWCDIAL